MSHFLLVIGVIGLTLALVNVGSLARASSSHRGGVFTYATANLSVNGELVGQAPVPTFLTYIILAERIYTIRFEIAPLAPDDVVL